MFNQSKAETWLPFLIVIGFPVLYMLYSSSSFAQNLFEANDLDYYIPFWSGIILLHWTSVFCVARNLKKRKLDFGDIGLKHSKSRLKLLVTGYFVVGLAAVAITEYLLAHVTIDPTLVERLPGLIPITTEHRIFFIFLVFSTGVCEEIVYRGFAISFFAKNGVNKWLALLIAAFIFVGIHGFYAYFNRFIFLFGGGVMFGVIYLVSKRLLPGMMLHLAINLSSMFAILTIQIEQ